MSPRPTRISIVMGFVLWSSYAYPRAAWSSPTIIAMAIFIALILPTVSIVSNAIDQSVARLCRHHLAGRIARFAAQLLFNVGLFIFMVAGRAIPAAGIDQVGGVLGAAALTTMASQGLQAIALDVASRGIGSRNGNVVLALSANIVVTALGTVGVPWAREAFLYGGGLMAILTIGGDLRRRSA